MAGAAEAGDRFGAALASGLVDSGDEADLAVGAPGEDVGATGGAGAVSLVDGRRRRAAGQRQPADHREPARGRGRLRGGGGDRRPDRRRRPTGPDDLAVGAPGENVGATVDAGAVSVLAAADNGSGLPAGAVQERFYQGNNGVPGASEAGDGSAPRWSRGSSSRAGSTWLSASPARTSARPPTPARPCTWSGRAFTSC